MTVPCGTFAARKVVEGPDEGCKRALYMGQVRSLEARPRGLRNERGAGEGRAGRRKGSWLWQSIRWKTFSGVVEGTGSSSVDISRATWTAGRIRLRGRQPVDQPFMCREKAPGECRGAVKTESSKDPWTPWIVDAWLEWISPKMGVEIAQLPPDAGREREAGHVEGGGEGKEKGL